MCSCNNSPIPLPQDNEWAPKTWLILHTLSLKAGRQTNPLFQRDEMLAWENVLKKTGSMLPCSECKGHYIVWVQERKAELNEFPKLSYGVQTEFVRRWFFNLHNDINLRQGKPVLSYDAFLTMYPQVLLLPKVEELSLIIKSYSRVSGYIASPSAYAEWKKHIIALISL